MKHRRGEIEPILLIIFVAACVIGFLVYEKYKPQKLVCVGPFCITQEPQ